MADQQDCSQFGWWDPRYYACLGQNLGNDINPANLAAAGAGAIGGLAVAPLKALHLNSFRDGMWRLLLILLGLMSIGFGLMLFAGVAIKEEAGSQTGQQVESSAKTAAMAAAA